MSQPSSSKEVGNGKKQDALPGRAPPEKASECLVRLDWCRKWAEDYAYPGSMGASPEGALSIHKGQGVPRVVACHPQAQGSQTRPARVQSALLPAPLLSLRVLLLRFSLRAPLQEVE